MEFLFIIVIILATQCDAVKYCSDYHGDCAGCLQELCVYQKLINNSYICSETKNSPIRFNIVDCEFGSSTPTPIYESTKPTPAPRTTKPFDIDRLRTKTPNPGAHVIRNEAESESEMETRFQTQSSEAALFSSKSGTGRLTTNAPLTSSSTTPPSSSTRPTNKMSNEDGESWSATTGRLNERILLSWCNEIRIWQLMNGNFSKPSISASKLMKRRIKSNPMRTHADNCTDLREQRQRQRRAKCYSCSQPSALIEHDCGAYSSCSSCTSNSCWYIFNTTFAECVENGANIPVGMRKITHEDWCPPHPPNQVNNPYKALFWSIIGIGLTLGAIYIIKLVWINLRNRPARGENIPLQNIFWNA